MTIETMSVRRWGWAWMASAALGLVGCDEGGASLPTDAAPAVDAPVAEAGGLRGVSGTVGPEGGELRGEGVTLTVPRGALDRTVTLRAEDTGRPAPPPYMGYSTVWRFSPEGLTFARPVAVTLPFEGSGQRASLAWSLASGPGYEWRGGTVIGSTLRADVEHFSTGFVASRDAADASDLDAPTDATATDAAPVDAPVPDAGPFDAATSDLGGVDAAGADAVTPDVTRADVGSPDAGAPDVAAAPDVATDVPPVSCSAPCPTGSTCCDGYCVDATLSADHCGACGVRCAVACSAGRCVTARAVAASGSNACIVLSDGTLRCQGPDGIAVPSEVVAPGVASFAGATQVSLSARQRCMLRGDGTVHCLDQFTGTLRQITGLSDVVQVSSGGADATANYEYTACAVLRDGGVRCWGSNRWSQLGDGTTSAGALLPVTPPGLPPMRAVAVGRHHACAVASDGGVWCWGYNFAGSIGEGLSGEFRRAPVRLSTLSGAVAVATTGERTCAVRGDGTVACWGDGVTTPTTVAGLAGATAVGAGVGYACAVVVGGHVRCWSNGAPAEVVGVQDATAVVAGNQSGYALRSDGSVVCWGDCSPWGLSRSTYRDNYRRRLSVTGLPPGVAVAEVVPVSEARVVRLQDGTFWRFPLNDPAAPGLSLQAVALTAFGSGVEQISVGSQLCARRGTVVVCGEPGGAAPTTPTGLGPARSVTGGVGFSCALLVDGTVRCWGSNSRGQLGNGMVAPFSATPTAVAGLDQVVDIASLGNNTCAVRGDRSVWCWGEINAVAAGGYASLPARFDRVPMVDRLLRWGQGLFCTNRADGGISCWIRQNLDQPLDLVPAPPMTETLLTGPRLPLLRRDGRVLDMLPNNVPGEGFNVPWVSWATRYGVANSDRTTLLDWTARYRPLFYGAECGVRPGGALECWASTRTVHTAAVPLNW